MKTTNVSRAKRDLSQLLRLVERGETILIVRRGKPVARLSPAGAAETEDDLILRRLEVEGTIRRAAEAPDIAVLDEPAPHVGEHGSLLRALIAERDEGR